MTQEVELVFWKSCEKDLVNSEETDGFCDVFFFFFYQHAGGGKLQKWLAIQVAA